MLRATALAVFCICVNGETSLTDLLAHLNEELMVDTQESTSSSTSNVLQSVENLKQDILTNIENGFEDIKNQIELINNDDDTTTTTSTTTTTTTTTTPAPVSTDIDKSFIDDLKKLLGDHTSDDSPVQLATDLAAEVNDGDTDKSLINDLKTLFNDYTSGDSPVKVVTDLTADVTIPALK